MVLQMPRPQPDAVHQAYPFDPTTAGRQQVDAERARERTIRTDQVSRVVAELERLGYDVEARYVAAVDVEPGW